MRSQLLQRFDRDTLPSAAAERWFGADVKVEHVQDSESFVYRISRGETHFYLRFTHEVRRSREQIAAELEYVQYVSDRGVAVARPVQSRAGHLIEDFEFDGLALCACVFEAAPGARLMWRTPSWNAENFQRWGQALGILHANTLPASAARTPRRMSWHEDDVWVNADTYLSPDEHSARRELSLLRAWLNDKPQTAGQFGLIHGDLCAANFFIRDDVVTLFDFDDCCYHWFIYDLVCTVSPATFRPTEERHALRDAIVEGYVKAHPLPRDWEAQFNQFLRMRGLYLFILHRRNWDGDAAANPKRGLIDRLRASFDEPAIW
jgi:Ser/Thr protein kinase RdoA (MazF antagonist)